MRFIRFIVLATLLVFGCSEPSDQGRWELIHSQSDGRTYSQIHFANSSTGWIVGDNGTVKKTKDGGSTWESQNSGITSKFWDISSVTKNLLWICGHNGSLIKTSDGGDTWQTLLHGDTLDGIFISVAFVDENVGWLSNNNGSILKTMDGGITWELSKKHSSGGAWIFAFDDATQYHVKGKLFRTFDGGASWDSVSIDRPANYSSWGASFPDKDHGFLPTENGTGGMIIEEYPVLSTQNGGESWQESPYLETGGYGLRCIWFIDGNTGWVGGSQNMFKTTDGGESFSREVVPDEFHPRNMTFIDENHGWAVSYSGEVYRYSGD
ncbi:MAG: hypothetical protein HQ510_13075 [Candidatus Marinimicrobia bacterium]|nr:hypothetical protein [Candidatus Neomarinimicrobiota bacterium]